MEFLHSCCLRAFARELLPPSNRDPCNTLLTARQSRRHQAGRTVQPIATTALTGHPMHCVRPTQAGCVFAALHMLLTFTHGHTHSRQRPEHIQHMHTRLDTLVVLRAVAVRVYTRAREGVCVLAADTLIVKRQHPDATHEHMGPSRQNHKAEDTPRGYACKCNQEFRPHRHFLATGGQQAKASPLL